MTPAADRIFSAIAGNLRERARKYREKGYPNVAADLEREAEAAEAMAQVGATAPRPRIEPCIGIDGAPCPQKKGVVVRNGQPARCPDCKLAHGRIRQAGKARKAMPAKVDDQALLERIARSTPPGYDVVDGVLDAEHEIPDGSEDMGDVVEERDELEETKPLRAKDLAKAPAPKPRPTTFNQFKPGTRQLPKPEKVTGERNWWETAKPGEMTKTAKEQQPRMSSHKEAKRVRGFVND